MEEIPIHPVAARGFRRAASLYERARPGYPDEAVGWLVSRLEIDSTRTVVDLGAGTGKLSQMLVPTGARVVAVEPIAAMRAELAKIPAVDVLAGSAEAIPLADRSVDAVTVAQAFHWFHVREALSEIARVLRRGGGLGLMWNRPDLGNPVHAAIARILERATGLDAGERAEWKELLAASREFSRVESRAFASDQPFRRGALAERIASLGVVAALPSEARHRVLDDVHRLDMQQPTSFTLPYRTEVYACRLRSHPGRPH